jgi:hypothetical protein
MPRGFGSVLASARVSGTQRVSFTTAISALPNDARCVMDPSEWYAGRSLFVRASGEVSNVVTAQPTFTFEFRLGPTSNIVAWSSGAILTSTTAHTTVPWYMELSMTVRAVGAGTAANIMGQGWVTSRAFLDAGATADITTLGHPSLLVPETTPAVGTGFDSTVTNVADLFVACSVSNAANAITLHQFSMEDLGA